METYEQLRRLYAAFNERDIERVLAALHPEVVWPNGWEGGTLHGVEAVRTYWLRQWQAIDPRVEPVRWWTEPDGRITVEVHQVVRSVDGRGAVLGESTVEHVYRWRDGLVDSMEIREPAAPPMPHTPPTRPPRTPSADSSAPSPPCS